MPDSEPKESEAQVAEADATAEANDGATETQAAEERREYVLDGQTYYITPAEERAWAAKAMSDELRRRRETESATDDEDEEEEPELQPMKTPQPTAESGPSADRIANLEKVLDRVEKKLEKQAATVQQEREEREKAESDRRYREGIDSLERKFGVYESDEDIKEMVEQKALSLFRKSAGSISPVTFETAYKQARDKVGELLADQKKTWIKGKVDARRTAAETPGGSGAITGAATNARAKTKEQQRASAKAYVEGSTDYDAEALFDQMLNAPEDRMAGAM